MFGAGSPTLDRLMHPVHGAPLVILYSTGRIDISIGAVVGMALQTETGKDVDILGDSCVVGKIPVGKGVLVDMIPRIASLAGSISGTSGG